MKSNTRKQIKISDAQYIDTEVVQLNVWADSAEAADHLLAYLYTCVGTGTIGEVIARLFPFEDEFADAVSHRLNVIMKKAAAKFGY